MSRPLRVLLLYWHPKGSEMRLAVRQHLHLLEGRGPHVLYQNAFEPTPPWIAWTAPDLCILHTTFLCARWNYDFEAYRRRFRWVSKLRCPTIALPQDEYDHAEVLDEWLLELGATSVYSCFGAEQRALLYPVLDGRAEFHETLTGFIDRDAAADVATRMVAHTQRPRDIVYRARNLPYWFGSHGQLKHRIAEVVQERAPDLGLTTDISTRPEDTVYGDDWLDFLMTGRAVIGCESGSSVLDRRGEIQRRISQLLAERPDLGFEELDAQMPPGWDSYAFFAISPRHLEAVITKTAQVLVEGRYSGVLEPERHYIPLRRDFTNLEEALERLRDVEAVEEMTERAYRDVYLSGRYNLQTLADQLCEEVKTLVAPRVAVPLALARRPSFPVRSPVEGKPVRKLIPHALTFAEALTRQPEARRLVLAALLGRVSTPLRDVVKDVVLLRVLARIKEGGARSRGDSWSLAVENEGGTIVIRTLAAPQNGREVQLGSRVDNVVWIHSAVAKAAPIFPRHPRWGWVSLGNHGRYDFTALAEVAKTDVATARALLERTLTP